MSASAAIYLQKWGGGVLQGTSTEAPGGTNPLGSSDSNFALLTMNGDPMARVSITVSTTNGANDYLALLGGKFTCGGLDCVFHIAYIHTLGRSIPKRALFNPLPAIPGTISVACPAGTIERDGVCYPCPQVSQMGRVLSLSLSRARART
jgi:hypothetical protein